MPPISAKKLLITSVVLACTVVGGYLLIFYGSEGLAGNPAGSTLTLESIPFDGAKSYEYLKQICALGPRYSGSPGMQAQQKLLSEHFQQLGGQVSFQEFRVRHPLDGSAVPMANLFVQWHPERKDRILLCAHYDTRPYPDRDPLNPRGTFVGANDGASGVALLMELGRHMANLPGALGVDFLLFDGEELVYREPGTYFIGSEYFAKNYKANPPSYKYRYAVLLDMVGDADLQIYQERNSMWWRDTRPLVADIWQKANKLGVREFVAQKRHEIRDDHLALHNIAKIPACDIIDFDYPHWHTEADAPAQCSALSLAKVGWVMNEWLKDAVKK